MITQFAQDLPDVERSLTFDTFELVLLSRCAFERKKRTGDQYLKIAALALRYDCMDVAPFCCREVDIDEHSGIGRELVRRLKD